LIGIMSDSHDNLKAIQDAVLFFNERNVTTVLHAGDIISPFTARAFKDLDAKLYFVFGNNDGDKITLKSWFEDFGAEACGDLGDLEIDGRRIALLHGTSETVVRALAASGDFHVVIRGHTHDAGVVDVEGTPVINPGETAGVLTGQRTVAILDTSTLDVEVVKL